MTEKKSVEILGIYPGMYASKFFVREDKWNYYMKNCINHPGGESCFVPCKDGEGDEIYVDMTKLLAFYVLKMAETSSDPKTKKKKKTNA